MLEIFDRFRNFETLLNKLEELLNKFLAKINIESQLQITINDENKSFYIQLNFERSNEEHIKFEELTTPEKIFYVISLYISFKIHINSKIIIFSNLFIPKAFNKRGSIFRTIERILPVIEKDISLNKYIFIFCQ